MRFPSANPQKFLKMVAVYTFAAYSDRQP